MDLNKYISKSFDNRRTSHDRSTVFDATREQAELSHTKTRPKLPPTDLNRKPISQRSSNTFESEIFKPPARQIQKFRLNQPQDHSSKDFYAVGQSEFYRKSLVSDFKPNFKPNFTYRPGWEVTHPGFEIKAKEQIEESSSIKPVVKRGNKSDSRREALNNRLDRFEQDEDGGQGLGLGKSGMRKTSSVNKLERRSRLDGDFGREEFNRTGRVHRFDRGDEYARNDRLERSQGADRYEARERAFDRNDVLDRPQMPNSEAKMERKVKFTEASGNEYLSQTSRTPVKPAMDSAMRPIYKKRPKSAVRTTERAETPTAESTRSPHLHNPPNPSSSHKPVPKPAANRSYSPSSPVCLKLTGLSSSTSEFSIREACKNVQILGFKSSHNHITGASSGTASVTIKACESSLASIQSSLQKQGLQVELSPVSLGKKNNYSELAHVDFLNQYVNRDSSKTPVKHHLESSQDVFGSSPGVGRYHSGKKVRDQQALVLQNWNFVKNPKKEEKLNENLNSLPSYMRSTQSSARKCKKIN